MTASTDRGAHMAPRPPGKADTEVAPAGPSWEAESEHQDYLERYPNGYGYICHFTRPGWKLPHREETSRQKSSVAAR
jgi:peptide methionine sulfoxide reductase MsrA